MAKPGATGGRRPAAAKAPALDLDGALSAIRDGKPAQVYLLDGDPFLTLRGARSIAHALVPEERRPLNLVETDPAVGPGELATELGTGGLFGGEKVVLAVEPAFLQSKEDLGGAFAKASDMWREGRQREAARRLVALAARLGWSTADLSGDAPPRPEEWEEKLQSDEGLRPEDGVFLVEAGRYAGERNLQAAKDDVSALEGLLERGLPRGHVLVIAAGKVDGRLPLVKRLASAGCRIPLAVQTEGTWDAQRLVLAPLLAELLAGTGKSVDAGGEERLAALVGDDARALAAEVAKLVTFVGDRKVIRGEDVDQLVVRTTADPFFALGNAVESRDLPGALGVLRRSLADGASPHMLVGSLAGAVRRMLVERERGRAAAGARRIASFSDWSAAVLPTIDPGELRDRKPYGLWMKYQASLRFGREELLAALAALAEADHSMKTGSDGAVLVERWLVGTLRTPDRERRTA
ncbi:MAG: DNA polymerase III subunit delta [Deltaproteobacteria bacterium]